MRKTLAADATVRLLALPVAEERSIGCVVVTGMVTLSVVTGTVRHVQLAAVFQSLLLFPVHCCAVAVTVPDEAVAVVHPDPV